MQAVSRRPDRLTSGDRPVVALATAVGVLFLFPAGYLAWATVRGRSDAVEALTNSAALRPIFNSLVLAITVTMLCAAIGSALAWLVVRTDVVGRRLLRTLLPLPLAIPSFVGATAFLAGLGQGGLISFVPRLNGFIGATVVLTLLSYPYVYLPVSARLRSLGDGLEEVAMVLDPGFFRMIRRVVLPQISGAITAGGLLTFLYVLSDFGAVSLMRYDAITRAIFSARLADRTTSLTLGFVLAVIALVVAWLARRSNAPARPVGARPARRYGLGRTRSALSVTAWGIIGLAFVLPIVVFVYWTVRPSMTIGVGFSGLGDDLGFLVEPLLNSTAAAVTAAVVAAIVVLPVAYAAARSRSRLASVSAASVASVFALPGLVVALALVFWVLQAGPAWGALYQTFPLLILGYVLHFGAQSMTATRAAVASLPISYDEAARTLGASRLRRFLTIEAPLLRTGVLAGGGMVLLSTIKELPATLLLAPTGFQTLATQIWGAAEDGFFAEVGVSSLVLIALSWALTWGLVLRDAGR